MGKNTPVTNDFYYLQIEHVEGCVGHDFKKGSRVAGTMVAHSSSVRAVARSNLSQVPPLHMHVGK